jgi:anti-anti-sigma factor
MLEIETRLEGPTLFATVRGEADASNSAGLLTELSAALSAGSQDLVIDASGITFADCSALHSLLELRSHVLSAGRTMTIIKPSPQFLRLLDLTELLPMFGGPRPSGFCRAHAKRQ